MVTGELSFDSKALRITEKGTCLFSIELSYCEIGVVSEVQFLLPFV